MTIRALALVSTFLLPLAVTPAYAASDATPAGDGAASDQIIVTAPRAEAEARETQKLAPNLINVQSAEAIAKYPDFNAAEALGRVPGISLSQDTGEGRFVNIRGIDGNLNGATYGGVVLLNTNPGGTVFGSGRAVEFDTIPTGAIDGIIVTKSGRPDHDAEGLGGSVELTPRSAARIDHPFADGAVGYGYEPAHKHGGPLNLDLAIGARFGGDNEPFSFVITGSRRDDKRGFDDLEADYLEDDGLTAGSGTAFSPTQVSKAFDDLQLRRYDYNRRRFGYGGEFAYTPNEDHQIYIRASVAGYIESALKNQFRYSGLGDAPIVDPSNANGFATVADLSVRGTNEEETHRNQVYVVGGRDRFGDFHLDWHVAYSRATFKIGRNYGSRFDGPTGVAVTYDNITDADHPALKVTDGTNVNDPTLYTLSRLTNGTENAVDDEWSYAANGVLDLHLLGDDSLKFGSQIRIRTKTDHQFTQGFDVPATTPGGLLKPAITNFYGGRYSNGPLIDEGAIKALAGTLATDGLEEDSSAFFRANEDIYAGYAMYSTSVGDFGFLGGARIEWTDARYTANTFTTTPDPDGGDDITTDNGPSTTKRNYINVFPSAQLKYSITPSIVARATYSTGIGRPGFSQVAQPVSVDLVNEVITTGNPNLQPTTGDSFDASLEWYLPHSGILSVGVFDKEFKNYILARTRTGPDARIPNAGNQVTFVTFGNVDKAHARGIEAQYVQRFAFLPAPFDGFGLDLNGTYVDSKVGLRVSPTGVVEYRRLPATSEFTGNAAVFYEAHGLQVRLSAQYVGANLFGIGDEARFDVYQDKRTTLDFTSAYDVTKNFRVYFNVKNLTNAPYRIYEASSKRPIQREFYDDTYEAGVKFKF